MSTDVIMPQMGESIAEGTVTKWLKQVGDHIKRDEPLFEISTDKVDAEIPAPAEGVLLVILVDEGETVEINTVVGRIGEEGEAAAKLAPGAGAPAPTESEPSSPVALQPTPAATVSRASLAETKRQLYTDLHRDVGSSVEESEALLERMVTEPDFARGVAAFRTKQPPDFE